MRWIKHLGITGLVAIGLFALGLFLAVNWARNHVEDILAWVAGRLGYGLVIEHFEINDPQRITVHGLTAAKGGKNFLWLERLEVSWRWLRLLRFEIEEIRVLGAYVWLLELQEAIGSHPSTASSPPQTFAPFSILLNRLVLREIVLNLNNLGPGIPNLPIRVADVDPIVLENLQLGHRASGDSGLAELQRAEIRNLIIYSPYFPLTPVLSFDRITFVFSMAGLAQQQLDRLSISGPTIFVSQDLFWYLEDVKKAQSERGETPADPTFTPGTSSPLWNIANYDVRGGRIIIALDGTPNVVLPMVFESEGRGLVLGDFSQLQLRTRFVIPPSNLDYPEYSVRITNMRGDLFFGLPPGRGEANIVPTVKIDEVRWKDLFMTDVDFGLTFNENGIFGKFGGFAYSGYLDGGFAVYLRKNFPWQGWGSTTRVDIRPVTELLSPQNFLMDGQVDARFLVSAYARQIVGLEGDIQLNQPGTLHVTAIDELLERLPDDWGQTKRDLGRIALEAFQRYDYTSGVSRFKYAIPFSELTLQLDGQQGRREFNLTWNQQDAEGNPLPAIPWSKE